MPCVQGGGVDTSKYVRKKSRMHVFCNIVIWYCYHTLLSLTTTVITVL